MNPRVSLDVGEIAQTQSCRDLVAVNTLREPPRIIASFQRGFPSPPGRGEESLPEKKLVLSNDT
jgi:hypothetical protein